MEETTGVVCLPVGLREVLLLYSIETETRTTNVAASFSTILY
jgi:hypothetical protein